MAIHNGDSGSKGTNNAQQPQQPHPQNQADSANTQQQQANPGMSPGINWGATPPDPTAQQQAFTQQPTGKWSWSGYGANPYSVNNSMGSQVLNQTIEVIKDLNLDLIAPQLKIDVIPVDRSNAPKLAASILIVCVRLRSEGDTGDIAHHTMILSGSLDREIPHRIETFGQKQYQVTQLISDAYDQVMRETIHTEVKNQFPNAASILSADADVVSTNYVVSKESVHALMVNAINACSSQLQRKKNVLNKNLVNNDGSEILFQTLVVGDQGDDGVDPVRQDFLLTTLARPAVSQGQYSIVGEAIGTPCMVAGGFLTFDYDPSNKREECASATGAMITRTPTFTPRIVLTNVYNARIPDLSGLLLAVANSMTLTNLDVLLGLTKRRLTVGGNNGRPNMHDIGGLGYEVSVLGDGTTGQFDTSTTEFSDQAAVLFWEKFVRDGVIVSIDVPECGRHTWLSMMLAHAAIGRDWANAAIFKAADELTNGYFSEEYAKLAANGANNWFVCQNPIRIPVGYYQSAVDGGLRDSRDCDYLAVLNTLGDKEPNAITEYTDALYNPHKTWMESAQTRENIERAVLPNVHYVGFVQRITFESAALVALINAIRRCGYSLTPPSSSDISIETNTARYGASGASAASAIIQGNLASSMYAPGASPTGQAYNPGRFGNYTTQQQFYNAQGWAPYGQPQPQPQQPYGGWGANSGNRY